MLKVILTVGIPSSGKSTWAIQEVAKDPNNWVRINNDDLRSMMNESIWSVDYEKMIREARNFLIKEALHHNKNIIIDNLNLNRKHFDEVCRMAKSANVDVQVLEKSFYIHIDEALDRDSKREGKARVGEMVIKKWWKESGKEQHKFYNPRVEIFTKSMCKDKPWSPMVQDESLPKAIICDLDGSLCNITHRSPYDASKCLNDTPNMHVVEVVKLFYNSGYKIIFCSGREDKFKDLTKQWIDIHLNIQYELFMRPANDFRKDKIIKNEIFDQFIKNKYYVNAVIDDRLQVCQLWHELGLGLFRVGDPEAIF